MTDFWLWITSDETAVERFFGAVALGIVIRFGFWLNERMGP